MKKVSLVVLSFLSMLLVACSNGQGTTTDTPSTSNEATSSQSSTQESQSHRILVTINDQDYSATLNDSQASRSLLEQLPLEQSFRDFSPGYDEKITDLENSINYQSDETSNDPQAGDIAYWSPDNRIVFYWGDVGAYNGIHVLGHFEDSAAVEAIRKLTPTDTVSMRQVD